MKTLELIQTGYVLVRYTKETHLLRTNDILYIMAENNYSILFMHDQRSYCISKPLGSLASSLESVNFFRVHKSYLINALFAKSVSINPPYFIYLKNGEKIPLSRRKKKDFLDFILSSA